MNITADKFVGFLRYPAALLDARYFLAFVLICLLASSRDPAGISAFLDKSLFHLAGMLQNSRMDGSHYVKVSFSPEEQKRFLQDPASARELMTFFDELSRSFVRSVAVILPQKLPEKSALEQLLVGDVFSSIRVEDPAVEEQIKAISSRWQVLESIRVNQKYVFAIREPSSGYAPYTVFTVPGYAEGWYGSLLDAMPVLAANHPALERQAPLLPSSGLAQPLLWKTVDAVRHDAVLEVFLRQQGLKNAEILQDGIQLSDERILKTTTQGVIYPRFTADQFQKAGVTSVSVTDLLKQNVKRSVHDMNLVVSAEDNPDADQFLSSLISLEQGYYASVPNFYQWLDVAMLVLVLLFALLAPYLSAQIGLLLFGLIATGFILLQQIMLLVHSLWIPVGEWLVFLLGSYLLMVLWGVKKGLLTQSSPRQSLLSRIRLPELPKFRADVESNTRLPSKPVVYREPSFRERDDELTDFDAEDTVMMDAETIRETRLPQKQAVQAFFRKEPSSVSRISGSDRKTLGPYEVLGELGRGAMGVVYLGFDPAMHRKVAIKTLHYNQFDPIELVSMKERFAAEAQAVGKLRHHNIVTMYELREERDIAYIAMDYVAGKSLASYTSKDNLLPVPMVYWIVAEVADALAYAHAAGIVHRDVKPSNILYDENSQEVKVADFGVARLLDSTLAKTRTGEVLGSPLYMSPEQIRGEKVTGQSDIYSLGVTFYQLLTGEFPFKADNIATLTRLILLGKFPAVDEVRPGLPASARKIINKALQKNLENRYPDALEMVAALDLALKRDFG